MNILIIEDNKRKYKDIEATLNRVIDNPSVTWKQSRNSGLIAIRKHNIINDNELSPFDLVICDIIYLYMMMSGKLNRLGKI